MNRTGLLFNSALRKSMVDGIRKKLHYETAETNSFVNVLKSLKNQHGSIDLDLNNDNGAAIVTLNNPNVKNAVDGAMMLDFLKVIQELEIWKEGKVVLMKGANGFFCSGGDLNNFVSVLSNSIQDGLAMCQFMQDLTTRFSRLPLLSVAIIQGGAVGGGAELTTCCDFRLMSPNASVTFGHKKIGITTGWGGGPRLVKIVGRRNAIELLSGGAPLEFLRAEEIGFADGHLSNTKDPVSYCMDWLGRRGLLAGDPHLMQSFKSMAAVADDYSVDIALAHERDMFERHWGSDGHNINIQKHLRSKK